MRIVVVNFRGSDREYEYKTDLQLIPGATYMITADDTTKYSSSVEVLGYRRKPKFQGELRTITKADCLAAPAMPDDNIEKVFFDEAKGVSVVLWKDGVRTKVTCHPEEKFDKEKALALCYMKRYFRNRGGFNKVLKKFCD